MVGVPENSHPDVDLALPQKLDPPRGVPGQDMGIALDESKRMGLSLPGLALAHQLYLSVQAQGHARCGTHALQLALASLSGIDWKNR